MNHQGTKRLETERLILRRFNTMDAENMYKNWASDTEVTKFLTWPVHASVEVSKNIITTWEKDYTLSEYYQWCIELKTTGEAMGSISVVHVINNISALEIGYCIARDYWGLGIASEAFTAVISYLFNEVRANRIEARHDVNNPASGKVMEKCGLVKEGIKRQGDRNNVGICDVAIYGLLKEDWLRTS